MGYFHLIDWGRIIKLRPGQGDKYADRDWLGTRYSFFSSGSQKTESLGRQNCAEPINGVFYVRGVSGAMNDFHSVYGIDP